MPLRYDDDADLVQAACAGDSAAFTTLYRRWFDPCFDIARRIVRDDGRAAEVAQETFLVAWNQLATLRDPAAFGGWVARTARNKALNRLERERRNVSVDDTDPTLASLDAGTDVAADVTRVEHRDLVWAAAAALGPRDASVLDLHLRHGLDAAELAAELEVTTNNAYQLLFRLKARLGAAIRAWVLFGHGSPACEDLRRELATAGVTAFDAGAVKLVERHVPRCEECRGRQAEVLAPEAMFAAVPMLAAGLAIRTSVAEGLRAAGVPLGPDAPVAPPAQTPGSGAGSAPGAVPPDVASPGPASPDTTVRGTESGPGRGANRRRTTLAAAAVLVVLLALAGGVALVAAGDDDVLVAGPATSVSSAPAPTATARATGSAPPGSLAGPGPTPPGSARSGAPDAPDTTDITAPDGLVVPPSTTTTIPPAPPSSPTITVIIPPPPDLPPTTPAPETTLIIETTTTTSTTSTVPAAPTIDSFLSGPGGACPAGQFATTATWTTTNATTVTIEAVAMTARTGLPPDGTAVLCRPTPGAPPGGWTVRATGPGGTITKTFV